MKVAAYARVSTSDKNQDPETQLLAISRFCESQGWHVVSQYVDYAPARDLRRRTGWRELLGDAGRRTRGFDAVVVFKLDRAFRSVKEMHDTLAAWDRVNVGFRTCIEQFDNTSAIGRLMMNILGSLAEFEVEMIRDRVLAGMDRAAKNGKRIGRPAVTSTPEFQARFAMILPGVVEGDISIGLAAKELEISHRTMKRLLNMNADIEVMADE